MKSRRRLGRRQIPLSLLTELRDSSCDLFPKLAAWRPYPGLFTFVPYGDKRGGHRIATSFTAWFRTEDKFPEAAGRRQISVAPNGAPSIFYSIRPTNISLLTEL